MKAAAIVIAAMFGGMQLHEYCEHCGAALGCVNNDCPMYAFADKQSELVRLRLFKLSIDRCLAPDDQRDFSEKDRPIYCEKAREKLQPRPTIPSAEE